MLLVFLVIIVLLAAMPLRGTNPTLDVPIRNLTRASKGSARKWASDPYPA
jgi:hypothetical protein